MKQLILIIVTALLVSGCGTKAQAVPAKSIIYQTNESMWVWCDNRNGVEYIGVAHGLSVRYSYDGTISKCDKN